VDNLFRQNSFGYLGSIRVHADSKNDNSLIAKEDKFIIGEIYFNGKGQEDQLI
jgi:hypothetical protein